MDYYSNIVVDNIGNCKSNGLNISLDYFCDSDII